MRCCVRRGFRLNSFEERLENQYWEFQRFPENPCRYDLLRSGYHLISVLITPL